MKLFLLLFLAAAIFTLHQAWATVNPDPEPVLRIEVLSQAALLRTRYPGQNKPVCWVWTQVSNQEPRSFEVDCPVKI